MAAVNISGRLVTDPNVSYKTVRPPDGVYSSSGFILDKGDNLTVSCGNSSGSVPYWDQPTTIILSTIISILIFLSIGGNLLVISVVVRHRGMRTRTNMFLVNLAMADFLVGLVPMPFSLITLLNGGWIFSNAICTINGFLNGLCLMTSNQLLMYISIHKYFSITRPFSRFLTVRKILMMIAAAWLWAIICSVLTVTGLQHVMYKNGTMQCGPAYPRDLLAYIHHFIIQITDIFIPLSVMAFCYIRIFIEIRKHTQRMRANSTLEKDTILAQQKKVTITLFIVLACFICCWLPYHIYASYVSYNLDRTFPPIINAVAYTMGYVNSACNPIIYALRSPSFREGYMEILCRKAAVVVSDDTLPPSTPSSFRGRMSTLIGSIRGSIRRSRAGSEVSLNSIGHQRISSTSSLHRLTSPSEKKPDGFSVKSEMKWPKGSSIIKRNGSVVIMKEGKIVCIRPEEKRRERFKRQLSMMEENTEKECNNVEGTEGHQSIAKERRPLLGNGHPVAIKTDSGFLDADQLPSNNNDIQKEVTFKGSHSMDSVSSGDNPHGNRMSVSLTDILESPCFKETEVLKAPHDLSNSETNVQELKRKRSSGSHQLLIPKLSLSRSTEHFDFSFFTPPQSHKKRLTKSDQCLDRDDQCEVPTKAALHVPLRKKIPKQKPIPSVKSRVGTLLRLPSVEHLDLRFVRQLSNPESTRPTLKDVPHVKRRSWFGFRGKGATTRAQRSQSRDDVTIL